MTQLSKSEIEHVDQEVDNFLMSRPPEVVHEEQHHKKRHSHHKKHPPKADLKLNSLLDALSVLIVFLIKSYSSATVQVKPNRNLQVPFTVSQAEIQQAVAVTITRKNVMINDVPVVDLEEGKVSPGDLSEGGMMIDPMFQKLRDEVVHEKKVAERRGEEFKGVVAFICDRHVPFPLITQAMYTAGQAEFSTFKFVLIKTERAGGT